MAELGLLSLLSESQITRLESLALELEQPSLLWASGYLAGLASAKGTPPQAVVTPPAGAAESQPLTIIYGSQTGNAKRVAEQLASKAEAAGLSVNLFRADAYKPRQLKNESLLYFVISTHSEGDEINPPDDSRGLLEFIHSRRAPKLSTMNYAVLALGDTSYANFCGIGRELDERLQALGATRIRDRGEADVDVETVAGPWVKQALEQAVETLLQREPGHNPPGGVVTPLRPKRTSWNRDNPFSAEILASQKIVSADSVKDVHHIELSLEGSGISYQPGDALGIWPTQDPNLVAQVIEVLGLDGDEAVQVAGTTLTLTEWLTDRRELTLLTRPFIEAHAARGNHDELQGWLKPEAREQLSELLNRWQLVDFLVHWPTIWDTASLLQALRPLAPRMYSIASSQAAVEEEVHLTIQKLHYQHQDEDRWGVASRYLCDLNEGDTASIFIDTNDRFRLPKDASRDVIMIGPGTGVAPFRAFVQEREESGAEGRNWLFFGNPNRRADFLYQLEWQQALDGGALTHLSVAFSRDQDKKIYVQDRLRENAAELWTWLDAGAHLYLCGDANRMAPDVHAALLGVIAEQGGKSADEASEWLKKAVSEGRYARDLY